MTVLDNNMFQLAQWAYFVMFDLVLAGIIVRNIIGMVRAKSVLPEIKETK